MKRNETPVSKAIKAKLRLVDDEVEEAWLGDRGHIYAELDPPPYFTATLTVDITHIHHRAWIESFAAITAILVRRKAKLMIAKALEALSKVDSDENLQVDMKNFILTFFDYAAYAQRLPVFVDEVERKLSLWRKDYNPEELGLTKIEDLFQSYVENALRTARNEIDVEFTLLRTQTTVKHLEGREKADEPISNDYEDFIRGVRVRVENQSEITIQEGVGRKTVSYTFESIGLGKKSRDFFLQIFEDPEHFCRIKGAPSNLYYARLQMLKAIDRKFINFFNRTFKLQPPKKFKCYERVKSEGPGIYRFKFQIIDDTLTQKEERELRGLVSNKKGDLEDIMRSDIQRGKVIDPLGNEDYPDKQD